ncbi:TPA: hypothetical protein N0F65_005085 [Lagenidium giganteum]|uniref:Expansin-like EG45 domain-containing protein n=1 Tax=Lagenidium giganteum TaxID=4803 RepID=A0AAV2YI48_9STRA|nr:TPA: hypothetical protein N0F65_005085 [Lagenidium giganteum]
MLIPCIRLLGWSIFFQFASSSPPALLPMSKARSTSRLVCKVLLVTAATAFGINADEYFEGDGTAYTLSPPSAGNCNIMDYSTDAVDNYAAINTPQWDDMKNCGRCAEVSCIDPSCTTKTTQVVHIMDRCPECKLGDLDLSPSVFKTITGTTPSRLRIRWKFIDCPVTGNVKYCLKGGSNNFWTAIQPANTVTGVSSMKINSQSTTMVTSAYYYLFDGKSATQTDLSSVKVTLTSVSGEVIEDTVSLTAGSCTEGKSQFTKGKGGSSGSTNRQVNKSPSPSTSSPQPTTATPVVSPQATEAPKPTPSVAPSSSPSVTPTATPSSSPPAKPKPSAASQSEGSLSMEAADIAQSVRPAATPTTNDSAGAGTVHGASTVSSSAGDSSSKPTTGNDSDTTHGGDVARGTSSPSPSPTTQHKEDNVQTANTKSGGSSTSITIQVLGSAAGVGVVALIAVAVITKRKKLEDKRADERLERSVITRSFGNMATPSKVPADIAMLGTWARLASLALLAAITKADETTFTADGTTYGLTEPKSGNCNFHAYPDEAKVKFAALNTEQFMQTKNCGRCAEVACTDPLCANAKVKKEVVYIVDQCPGCPFGDLDLGAEVFESITGLTSNRVQIKWKFVDCPVKTNVVYCLKGGSNEFWVAIQPANFVAGIESMQINGKDTTMVDSAYFFLLDSKSEYKTDLSSVKITLKSVNGEVIEDTVALTAGNCTEGKSQFKSGNPGDEGTEVKTQAKSKSGGTSPALIILGAGACVGFVVLAVMAVIVKRKKLDDKHDDRQDGSTFPRAHDGQDGSLQVRTHSFDHYSTPAQRADIAIL